MRRVTWFALFGIVLVGCTKSKPRETVLDPTGGTSVVANDPKPVTPTSPKEKKPARSGEDASGSRIINTKGNQTAGIGSGAIGGPRAAAARTVNNNQLRQLYLAISQILTVDDRVPDADEMKQILRENNQLSKLVADEVIILTGTKDKGGIFAYSQWPQRAGEHYVVTRQGVEQMAPAALRKRLEEQSSPIKLSR